MFFVYFAKSLRNNKVYVGFTTKKPDRRIEEHNNGVNKWSKVNGPFKLVYFESYYCKTDALLREKFYKMGFGKKVKKLIIEALSI